jgi:hypothetical protein
MPSSGVHRGKLTKNDPPHTLDPPNHEISTVNPQRIFHGLISFPSFITQACKSGRSVEILGKSYDLPKMVHVNKMENALAFIASSIPSE